MPHCAPRQRKFVNLLQWTFNCLAFLLKYLSRLLVPDLRPLFRFIPTFFYSGTMLRVHSIFAPLLGKDKQKPFVVRFAAEALSFLIRKSKEEPLRIFIQHVFKDLEENSGSAQYSQGLSSLFFESCIVSLALVFEFEYLLTQL